MPDQGKFELWYNRPTNWNIVRLADDGQSDESFRQRQHKAAEKKEADCRLNELSEQVREEIDTRLWAAMYLQHLTKRIDATNPVHIKFTGDLPKIQNLSLSDQALAPSPEQDFERPFKDLSLEIQLQILERRLKDARIGTEAIWASLNEIIVTLTSKISECPADIDIGFRAFDAQSQARKFPTGDIRCGNWQEFVVNQGVTRKGAGKHIRNEHSPTNFISLSTSPRRLWNIVNLEWSRDYEIAVIDLRVLQRLGIPYGSTTDDLGFRNIGQNRTQYATKHHVLVVGWIPRRSVLGVLSKENFQKLLEQAQIDTSGKAGDISSFEYDRKIPFELIRDGFEG